jgi:hypothetical protein
MTQWSPSGVLDNVVCGLTTSTRYDIACGLTRGIVLGYGNCCSCDIFFLLAVLGYISIPPLLALSVCLTGLRRYIIRDNEDLATGTSDMSLGLSERRRRVQSGTCRGPATAHG